jgi:hypothetical protein
MILSEALTPRALLGLDVFGVERFSTNPAVLRVGEGYVCLAKGVNFDFETIWLTGDWRACDPAQRVECRYKLLHLDAEFRELATFDLDCADVARCAGAEIDIEDLRLFWLGDAIYVCGSVSAREDVWTGRRWIMGAPTTRVFVAELVLDRLERPHIFPSPGAARMEKNWIPVVSRDRLNLITDLGAQAIAQFDPARDFEPCEDAAPPRAWRGWSGSSPPSPWAGGHLIVAHRKSARAPYHYRHMFIALDETLAPRRRSAPFSFEGRPVEFCCGLEACDDALILSYGVMDKRARIIAVARADIEALLCFDIAPGDLDALEIDGELSVDELRRRAELLDAANAELLRDLYLLARSV